ncbi:MAG: hypothetical protein NTW25_01930 [Candidatus Kapabacteria bacterium]|nr:hypothetical protein [Candidatus Kapabacteria bacterium]
MIKSKTDIKRISKRNNKQIDYSDIPETDQSYWADADLVSHNPKVDFTFKIDEDLAMWLKSKGSNSNQAVNNIIRAYYLTQS